MSKNVKYSYCPYCHEGTIEIDIDSEIVTDENPPRYGYTYRCLDCGFNEEGVYRKYYNKSLKESK